MQAYMRHFSSGHYDQHQAAYSVGGDGPLTETSEHSVSLPHLLHDVGGPLVERVDRNWYRTASNDREGARTNTTGSMGSQWWRTEDDRTTVGESSQQSMNHPELNEFRQRPAPPGSLAMPAVREVGGEGEEDGVTVVKGDSNKAGDRAESEHFYSTPASRDAPEDDDDHKGVHESVWTSAGIIGWLILLSLVYFLEVVSDIVAAVDLGRQGWFGAMAVCVAFILIPAALLAVLSLGLYRRDDAHYSSVDPNYDKRLGKLSILLHCLLLGPIHRHFRVALLAPVHKTQDFEHVKHDSDLLRYIALTLYTAPQLTLYFALLLMNSAEGLPTPLTVTVSAAISAVSAVLVLWSFAANDMLTSRESRQTVAAKVAIFNWNGFIIAARIIALGAFASHPQFGLYVFVVVGLHWVVMWIWVGVQRPVLGEDTSTQCEEQGKENRSGNGSSTPKWRQIVIKLFWVYYYVIVGMVQLFTFYNIKSGNTRYRLVFYYGLVGAESLALVLVYHFFTQAWPSPLLVTLECSALAIGITWMLLYYLILHPTQTEGWTKLGIPPFCCPLCRSHANIYNFHNASNDGSPRSSVCAPAVGMSAVGALDRMRPITQQYNNHFSMGSYNKQFKVPLSTGEVAVEPYYVHYLTQTSDGNSAQKQGETPSSPSHSFPHSLPLPLYITGPATTTADSVRRDSTVQVSV